MPCLSAMCMLRGLTKQHTIAPPTHMQRLHAHSSHHMYPWQCQQRRVARTLASPSRLRFEPTGCTVVAVGGSIRVRCEIVGCKVSVWILTDLAHAPMMRDRCRPAGIESRWKVIAAGSAHS